MLCRHSPELITKITDIRGGLLASCCAFRAGGGAPSGPLLLGAAAAACIPNCGFSGEARKLAEVESVGDF